MATKIQINVSHTITLHTDDEDISDNVYDFLYNQIEDKLPEYLQELKDVHTSTNNPVTINLDVTTDV